MAGRSAARTRRNSSSNPVNGSRLIVGNSLPTCRYCRSKNRCAIVRRPAPKFPEMKNAFALGRRWSVACLSSSEISSSRPKNGCASICVLSAAATSWPRIRRSASVSSVTRRTMFQSFTLEEVFSKAGSSMQITKKRSILPLATSSTPKSASKLTYEELSDARERNKQKRSQRRRASMIAWAFRAPFVKRQ